MTSPRPKVGDVFTVPIDDDRVGFGQVAGTYRKEGLYFAIFETAYVRSAEPVLSEVVADRVALLALSLDAKIVAGHWVVVGNQPVRRDLPLPAYKETVGTPDRVDVVDYSGELRRRATTNEIPKLANRKIVAPVRLERALRALHGGEQWQAAYDELRPVEASSSAHFFG